MKDHIHIFEVNSLLSRVLTRDFGLIIVRSRFSFIALWAATSYYSVHKLLTLM